MKCRHCLALALAVIAAAPIVHAEGVPRRHALLVGCTKYENPQISSLEGPANDVVLLRDVLKRLYRFKDEDCITLSEEQGKALGPTFRPTRANIAREFVNLAKKAKTGDKVVILLAGHGCQQPDSKPDDPERFEPDGKEEIFLPADAGEWDGVNRVKNAIVDYEFRDWLKDIRTTGAAVWVIVDACHSTSLLRGAGEVRRDVPAEKLIPAAVLRTAEEKARKRAADDAKEKKTNTRAFKLQPEEQDIAVIYAAQSIEPTVELILPQEGTDRKPRGLLTYTLCKTLVEAGEAGSPLSYEQLVSRIQDQYKTWNRAFPTPQVEGKDRHREVLGEKVREKRAEFELNAAPKEGDRGRTINAGTLHGLTAGTILRVFPKAGLPNADRSIGHARVLEEGLGVLQGRVEPVEFERTPAPKALPVEGGRCEIAQLNLGEQRLAVGVDEQTIKGEPLPAEKRQLVADELLRLAKAKEPLIEVPESAAAAQWRLQMDSLASGKVYLVPAAGALVGASSGGSNGIERAPIRFGPVPSGAEAGPWLQERLARVARVRNLLALVNRAARLQTSRGADLDVKFKLELIRFRDDNDDVGVPVTASAGGIVLHDKDQLVARVTNLGRDPIDVTMLLLDGEYGIDCVFPRQVNTDCRVQPGTPLRVGLTMGGKTSGSERFVVIAAKAKDLSSPLTFGFLAQPRLEKATDVVSRSPPAQQAFDSALGRLFRKAAYGDGAARGMEPATVRDYGFEVLTYEMSPKKRPAEPKK